MSSHTFVRLTQSTVAGCCHERTMLQLCLPCCLPIGWMASTVVLSLAVNKLITILESNVMARNIYERRGTNRSRKSGVLVNGQCSSSTDTDDCKLDLSDKSLQKYLAVITVATQLGKSAQIHTSPLLTNSNSVQLQLRFPHQDCCRNGPSLARCPQGANNGR